MEDEDQLGGGIQPPPLQDNQTGQFTTPGGAAAAGQNEDQAKMAGTPQQKKPQQYRAMTDYLSRRKRTQGDDPSKGMQQAAQQAQQKVDRLKTLGSIGTQLEAAIEARMQTAFEGANAALGLNEASLEGKTAEDQAAIRGAVSAYLASPSQSTLAAVQAATGSADVAPYFTGPEEVLASIGQQAGGAADFTVADLPDLLGGVDPAALAADLGVDAATLQGMTVPQLEAKIEEVQAQQFTQAESLKAEALSASPQRLEQINAELRTMGEAGILSQEQQVARLEQDIEAGQTVEFGGEEVRVEELLGDEFISDLITDTLTGEPEDVAANIAQLEQDEPALAEFLRDNMEMLQTAVTQRTTIGAELAKANENYAEAAANTGLSTDELASLGLTVSANPTDADVTALNTWIANNGTLIQLKKNPAFEAVLRADPSVLGSIQGMTPEQLTALSDSLVGKSDAEIAAMVRAGQAAKADPNYATFFGIAPGAVLADVDSYHAAMWESAVEAGIDLSGYTAAELDADDLYDATKHRDNWEERYHINQAVENSDYSSLLGDIFGESYDFDSLMSEDLPEELRVSPEDQLSQFFAQANEITNDPFQSDENKAIASSVLAASSGAFDVNLDGKVDAADFGDPAFAAELGNFLKNAPEQEQSDLRKAMQEFMAYSMTPRTGPFAGMSESMTNLGEGNISGGLDTISGTPLNQFGSAGAIPMQPLEYDPATMGGTRWTSYDFEGPRRSKPKKWGSTSTAGGVTFQPLK
jgi:hypothetical protein